ncbi:peptidoglycan synthetase [Antarcticibacterium sp. W02-3]|uniref:UDP-N-acetylmuramate--L-alanine ligase n=1 Tax=Antarcticibacterium sp. W02-3 TaxID=2183747 RepID=UPI002042FBD0|nr:Mur ligase family protein [Antarcticibacterium sp. W02-3]MCM4160463.1 peptidoglycan synthetase [Antarcticibacterium sp. W02-3]
MNIHFIAIGGSAMHNLALALHKSGHTITGSDDSIYEPSLSRLAKFKLLPEEMGWFPEKISPSLDAVILGMHARENNPELLKAQELGIKIFSYPEFLYEHAKNKTRVVIGGSHGKTTITSMILHVLDYHDLKVDYMVGAQLEGFEDMVSLSNDTDFMLLEGDEYLTSAIDRRPKFHLYKPNIALLSGIAWDHMNVFPTYEIYLEQFRIFVDSLVKGGTLVYNEEDEDLKEIVESTTNQIRKHPYSTPSYSVENSITVLDTPEGEMPVEIFGAHNLNNLAGAKWICQHMGVDEDDFYEAIASFKGASKRLEKVIENSNVVVYRDFAHSPSKVKASTFAVREQYPDKKLIACAELHTFSSLDPAFLDQYKDALNSADEALVFFSSEALKMKGRAPISEEQVRTAFGREDLVVVTKAEDVRSFLKKRSYENSVLLLMSSGNFESLDLEEVKQFIS